MLCGDDNQGCGVKTAKVWKILKKKLNEYIHGFKKCVFQNAGNAASISTFNHCDICNVVLENCVHLVEKGCDCYLQ